MNVKRTNLGVNVILWIAAEPQPEVDRRCDPAGAGMNEAHHGLASERHEHTQDRPEADLRPSTHAFTMQVGERTQADRKPAGASLLSRIRMAEKEERTGRSMLGTIGGFKIGMDVERLRREEGAVHVLVCLERTGRKQAVEIGDELTPLGLISRLEYILDRFEADLAEDRPRLSEAEQRLPAYRWRVGEVFAFEAELRDKEDELTALEVALANGEGAPSEEQERKAA